MLAFLIDGMAADFIGRLDVGSDLAKAKIIVLGQAKCEKLTKLTGGNDARYLLTA